MYCTGEISHGFQKHGSGFFRTLKVSVNPLRGGMWNCQTDKTESRTGITIDWEEGGNGKLLFNGDGVSVWEDEKALGMGSCDACTTMGMCLKC